MWVRLTVVVTAVFGVSACIIGPKQDDPAAPPIDITPDGAAPADTDVKVSDSSIGPSFETGGEADTAASIDAVVPKSDTSCASEAGDGGEAGCEDGSVSETSVSEAGESDAVAAD